MHHLNDCCNVARGVDCYESAQRVDMYVRGVRGVRGVHDDAPLHGRGDSSRHARGGQILPAPEFLRRVVLLHADVVPSNAGIWG